MTQTLPPLPGTETLDPRYTRLDAWPPSARIEAMWEGQMAAVAAVRPALPAIVAACREASISSRVARIGCLIRSR